MDKDIYNNIGCVIVINIPMIVDSIRFMDFIKFMIKNENYELKHTFGKKYALIKDDKLFIEYDNEDEYVSKISENFEHYSIIYDRKRKIKKLDYFYK